MNRLLIVEDEPQLRANLSTQFEQQGYDIDALATVQEALYVAEHYPIDCAIIDVGLHRGNGIELVKALRTRGKLFPIIMLTARSDWQEKVKALEAGADDYVTKPYIPEELHARVIAQLRRVRGFHDHQKQIGDLCVDLQKQSVHIGEHPIELTAYEYKILDYLLRNPNRPVTKIELTEYLYEQDYERDSNTIEVFVGRLRKKLEPASDTPIIETLRGRGYRLNMPEEATQ